MTFNNNKNEMPTDDAVDALSHSLVLETNDAYRKAIIAFDSFIKSVPSSEHKIMLVTRIAEFIFTFIYSMLKNKADADDLIQTIISESYKNSIDLMESKK